MDWTVIGELVSTGGVAAALLLGIKILYDLVQQFREDGKEREKEYQALIEKQNERFDKQDTILAELTAEVNRLTIAVNEIVDKTKKESEDN